MLHSAPFATCIRLISFQIFLFAAGVYSLYLAFSVSSVFREFGIQRFQAYDLEAVSRNLTFKPEIQFLRDGCPISSTQSLVEMNRFILTMPNTIGNEDTYSASLNAFRFKLFGTNDEENSMFVAGSCNFRWLSNNIRFLEGTVPWTTKISIDYRPPWPLYCEHTFLTFALGVGCICTGLCGFFNNAKLGQYAFISTASLIAAIAATSTLGYLSLSLNREAFLPSIEAIGYGCLASALIYGERFFTQVFAFVAIFSLTGFIVNDCSIFSDCSNLRDNPPAAVIAYLILSMAILVVRYGVAARALHVVREDQRVYDDAWRRASIDPVNILALHQLDVLAANRAGSCAPPPRQLNRPEEIFDNRARGRSSRGASAAHTMRKSSSASLWSFYGEQNVPVTTNISIHVTSLDQLYSQAFGTVSEVYQRITDWAAHSRGTVDDVPATLPAHRIEVELPKSMQHWIQRRYIKAPGRAIEKAITCYGGDVSRLLDICRGRILFQDADGLLHCVRLILADASVKVVRIRNTMDHRYNSRSSAGFRAMIMNFQLNDDALRSMGLETHICEVQLQLASMASLMDLGRHTRYLHFRAVRPQVVISETRESAPIPGAGFGQVVVITVNSQIGHRQSDPSLCDEQELDVERPLDTSAGALSSLPDAPAEDALVRSVDEAVKIIFVRATLKPGDFLDKQATQVYQAIHASSASSVIFTSKPLSAMGSKKVFQLLSLAVSFYFVYIATAAVLIVREGRVFFATTVRFSATKLRDPAQPLNSSSIGHFGLILDGCKASQFMSNSTNFKVDAAVAADNIRAVSFSSSGQPSAANGYFFETSKPESPRMDPVAWKVEASTDNGSTWFTVGASVSRLDERGDPHHYVQMDYPTPLERGITIQMDCRPTVSWALLNAGTCVGYFLTFFGSSITGMLGWEGGVRICWIFTLNCVLITMVIAAATAQSFRDEGQGGNTYRREATEYWLNVPILVIMILGIWLAESRIVLVLTIVGICEYVCTAVIEFWLYDSDVALWLWTVGLRPGTFALLFAAAVVTFRRRALRRAHQLVLADELRYSNLWKAVVSNQEANHQISELREMATQLVANLPSVAPRQLSRSFQLVTPMGGLKRMLPAFTKLRSSASEIERPVDSLDQLFTQALCLNPILLDKAKSWAEASYGCFPAIHSDGAIKFVNYADVRYHETAMEACTDNDYQDHVAVNFKWAKIKSVSRAIEKIVRSYGQDASRLVDICRQSIVFDSLSAITQCLRAISSDPEVRLLRIKNRYDLGYNAGSSAGYRDVAMNLQIVTETTRALGIEGHICEVQLLLRPFAEIKV